MPIILSDYSPKNKPVKRKLSLPEDQRDTQPAKVASTDQEEEFPEPIPLLASTPQKDTTSSTNVSRLSDPIDKSEREIFYNEFHNLSNERDNAKKLISELQEKLDQSNLSSISVENNDKKCRLCTGLSWAVFMQLFLFLSGFLSAQIITKDSLPLREQLFMTLVKLRHNMSFELLSMIKQTSKQTVINYFWKWIDLMYYKIGFLVKFQERDRIFKIIPPVFKKKFPRLTCIIDCFEVFIEAPSSLLSRAQCYSNYKHHCTAKVFISCGPLGHINFISRAWGGKVSDVHLVRNSGFISMNYHLPGDQILADRGFRLQDDFAQISTELIMPSFTKGHKQLPADSVENSRTMSSVRIHIERVIGLLRNRYTILKGPLQIRAIKGMKEENENCQFASIDKILVVCAALTNMGEGIVFKE